MKGHGLRGLVFLGIVTVVCGCGSGGGNLGINSVSPFGGSTRGGTLVTISGYGFTTGMAVKFGQAHATVISVNSTAITASSPSSGEITGAVDVVATAEGTPVDAQGQTPYAMVFIP